MIRACIAALTMLAAAAAQSPAPAQSPDSFSKLPAFALLSPGPNLQPGAKPREINSVMLPQTGTLAAATFSDKKLRIWKLPSGELLHTIDIPGSLISAISDDGHYILTSAGNGRTAVWDSSTGSLALELKLPRYPGIGTFSRDSKLLAITAQGGAVQIFDVAAKKQVLELPSGIEVEAVAFSHDGRLIATGGGDTSVKIYDARSGRLLAENHELMLEPLALDFTADDKQLIVGGGDRVLTFVDAATGATAHRWAKSAEPVAALGTSPDGKLLLALYIIADNMNLPTPLAIWDITSGTKKLDFTPPKPILGGTWLTNGHGLIALEGAPETIEVRVLY